MKRLFKILIPFLILGLVLYILIDFRQVEVLAAEEKQAIDRYRQELVKGTLLNKNAGIFYKEDFETLAISLDRLHQHANYVSFGSEWGYKITNASEEFATVKSVLNKPEYISNTKHKDFFDALKADLVIAQEKFETRESHDILDDLSTLVFIETIINERQWSQCQTIEIMKQQGLKLVKKGNPVPASNSTNGTPSPNTSP
jgi:hypothetical protein